MKSVKLASILLASGMLLGTVHTAVTPAYTAHAADGQTFRDESNKVKLEAIEVDIDDDGIITKLNVEILGGPSTPENIGTAPIPGMSEARLLTLFNGGELIIPETIGGKKITGIGSDVFDKDDLATSHPELLNLSGIAKLTFEKTSNITSIDELAFNNNAIEGELNLPEVLSIGKQAFANNELTSVKLPEVTEIDNSAFRYNDIQGELYLPRVTSIGNNAFESNALTGFNLPKSQAIGINAFMNQYPKIEKKVNNQGEVSYDNLLPYSKIGNDELKIIISNVSKTDSQSEDGNNDNIRIDNDNRILRLIDKSESAKTNLEMIAVMVGIPRATYTGNYSIREMELTLNSNNSTTNGGGSTGGNENTETDTSETPGTSTPDTTTPGTNTPETPIVISPDPEVNRPHTVYAKRAMRLHSNVSLTSPTESYKKMSRAKAKSFRVLGVSYDKSGKKRYKVKGGYITASTKYVADSHFRSSKVKQVRVIGNRVNSYKNVKLSKSQKVRSYKKGTKIKVKRIVKYGRTTRFQLNNGRYITGNKQLLIMDHSK